MAKLIDVSIALKHDMVVYPGDSKVEIIQTKSFAKGDCFCLHEFHFSSHTATHVDFPVHLIPNGKTSNDFSLDYFIGNGLVIDVPEENQSISNKIIEQAPILANDIVFFKTTNSLLHSSKKFHPNYVSMELKAAELLVIKQVKIVGVDYLSPDSFNSTSLPVHRTLLVNNVLIIENLNLLNVTAGRYKIYIVPIKTAAMDGVIARVFLETRQT